MRLYIQEHQSEFQPERIEPPLLGFLFDRRLTN